MSKFYGLKTPTGTSLYFNIEKIDDDYKIIIDIYNDYIDTDINSNISKKEIEELIENIEKALNNTLLGEYTIRNKEYVIIVSDEKYLELRVIYNYYDYYSLKLYNLDLNDLYLYLKSVI